MKENPERSVTIVGDYQRLASQSRGRNIAEAEIGLSKALIQSFAKGEHDFAVVVVRLNEAKVARSSPRTGAPSRSSVIASSSI